MEEIIETLECLAHSLRINSHKLHSLALHALFYDSAFCDPSAVVCPSWPLIDLNYNPVNLFILPEHVAAQDLHALLAVLVASCFFTSEHGYHSYCDKAGNP